MTAADTFWQLCTFMGVFLIVFVVEHLFWRVLQAVMKWPVPKLHGFWWWVETVVEAAVCWGITHLMYPFPFT